MSIFFLALLLVRKGKIEFRAMIERLSTVKTFLLDLDHNELTDLLRRWGEPVYRAAQLEHWLYGRLASSYEEMTALPAGLRRRLSAETSLTRLRSLSCLRSSDGLTRKWLFSLGDRERIETVLMRYDKRWTACVSTQAGCGMGCEFCATGKMGLKRNLSAGEIIEQVLHVARVMGSSGGGRHLTNLVLMGMGEPLANYDNVMKAIRGLIDPGRFGIGARRITLSTVGIIPGIDKFALEGIQVNLSVSLHAATDELRDKLVPANRRYPLRSLIHSIERYTEKTHRRVTFEWALIGGKNDTHAQAKALVDLVGGMLCHVNLIPLNRIEGCSLKASGHEATVTFQRELDRAGIPNTLRLRRGTDIHAGCGQLCDYSET